MPLLRSAVLAVTFGAVVFGATPVPQDVPTFRTGVFLVHIDAEVLGQNGCPVASLTKDDFRVLDGGQEQPIVAFSEGEQPLDLILLFDTSGSMRSKVSQVAAAAQNGVQELRQGDRVSIMAFSREARLVARFSEDLDATGQAIDRVVGSRFGGGTRIQDAVHEAANRFISFGAHDQRRRAVLVLTDNVGSPARHKMAVTESLWEADALLSGLVVTNKAAERSLVILLGGKRPGGIEDLVETDRWRRNSLR